MQHTFQGLGLFGAGIVLFSFLAGTAAAMSRPRWVAGSPKSYPPTPVAVVMAMCAFIVAVVVGTKVFLDLADDSGLWQNPGPMLVFAAYVIGAGASVLITALSALTIGPIVYDYLLGPKFCSRQRPAFLTNRRQGFDVP